MKKLEIINARENHRDYFQVRPPKKKIAVTNGGLAVKLGIE
jgi:hypothetical protein